MYKAYQIESILKVQKIGKSSFGLNYGTYSEKYHGIVINAATLPDGIVFEVKNGRWNGYIETDIDGNRIIYAGIDIDAKDIKENAINIIQIPKDEAYDIIIGDIIYVMDSTTTYLSKIEKLKFNPMVTDVFELYEALNNIKRQHEDDINKQKQLITWVNDMVKSKESIQTSELKKFMEQLYE